MKFVRLVQWLGTVAIGIAATAPAHADVTGSYDGHVAARKLSQPIAAAAVLTQTGGTITGTVVLPGDPSVFGGAYLVRGRATAKRLKLAGTVGGGRIAWRARIVGTSLQGPARLTAAGKRLAATLVLVFNPPLGDGVACDPVLAANQTYFADQILASALSSCGACHVPGGQATATRFRLTSADALATARSVAPLVDAADPGASRLLEKATAILPHGGGQQIVPGSPQEEALRHWADLVAQAQCN